MAFLFESEVCGRCGGSGHYSYNQRDGTVCYGCGGKKERLTKRGAEAQRFFRELMQRKVSELKIGDVVRYTGVTMGGGLYSAAAPVVELDLEPKVTAWSIKNGERIPLPHVSYVTEHSKLGRSSHGAPPDSSVEIVGSDEERREAIEKALAYQASLTKAGKPAKLSQLAHSKEEVNG